MSFWGANVLEGKIWSKYPRLNCSIISYFRVIRIADIKKKSTLTLPLLFLVVQTNVNYQVAAEFVTQEKTFEMKSQALQIIKGIIFFSLFFISNAL